MGEFNQVVIFVKSVQRCMALAQLLIEQNFPAIAIHRGMSQEERLSRYQQFKDFQKRILVATNLFGRGMDIERVNIVFNYDMPEDTDTYLHRVARAGRFGTKGLAITFVSDESDAKTLNEVQERFEVDSMVLIEALQTAPGLGKYNAQYVKEIYEDADQVFQSADADGNGEIEEFELRSHMKRTLPKYSDEAIKNIFRTLDKDGDKSISRKELREAFLQCSALRQTIGEGPNFK